MSTVDDTEQPAPPSTAFSRSQQWRDSHGVMHTVIDDGEGEREELLRLVLELRRKQLTDEELAFLRNKKQTEERYSWAWSVIRQYAGWVVVVGGVVGSVAVALAKAIEWIVAHVSIKL